MVPLVLTVASFGAAWWYVTIYNAPAQTAQRLPCRQRPSARRMTSAETEKPQELSTVEEKPQELGRGEKPRNW